MLEVLTTIGAIATPIVVAILGIFAWRVKVSYERQTKLQENLQTDRIKIYNEILEPFIILFMSDDAWNADPKNRSKNKSKNEIAVPMLLSLEYKRNAFRMALLGTDEVVRSYNNLMQYFFSQSEQPSDLSPEEKGKEMIALVGSFLLEIRKSMGNEATDLDRWEMLEWFITDARRYRGK